MDGFSLLLLLLAGAAGTLARYGLTRAVEQWCPSAGQPWSGSPAGQAGTLAVNVLGCLGAGLLAAFLVTRSAAHAERWRLVLMVGFLGGFTTFSAYALFVAEAARHQRWGWAVGTAVAHNLLGVGAVLLGVWIGRLAWK